MTFVERPARRAGSTVDFRNFIVIVITIVIIVIVIIVIMIVIIARSSWPGHNNREP